MLGPFRAIVRSCGGAALRAPALFEPNILSFALLLSATSSNVSALPQCCSIVAVAILFTFFCFVFLRHCYHFVSAIRRTCVYVCFACEIRSCHLPIYLPLRPFLRAVVAFFVFAKLCAYNCIYIYVCVLANGLCRMLLLHRQCRYCFCCYNWFCVVIVVYHCRLFPLHVARFALPCIHLFHSSRLLALLFLLVNGVGSACAKVSNICFYFFFCCWFFFFFVACAACKNSFYNRLHIRCGITHAPHFTAPTTRRIGVIQRQQTVCVSALWLV